MKPKEKARNHVWRGVDMFDDPVAAIALKSGSVAIQCRDSQDDMPTVTIIIKDGAALASWLAEVYAGKEALA